MRNYSSLNNDDMIFILNFVQGVHLDIISKELNMDSNENYE